jgi:hypothetical protein
LKIRPSDANGLPALIFVTGEDNVRSAAKGLRNWNAAEASAHGGNLEIEK